MLDRLCKVVAVYLALGLAALSAVMTFAPYPPEAGRAVLDALVWPWMLYQHFWR